MSTGQEPVRSEPVPSDDTYMYEKPARLLLPFLAGLILACSGAQTLEPTATPYVPQLTGAEAAALVRGTNPYLLCDLGEFNVHSVFGMSLAIGRSGQRLSSSSTASTTKPRSSIVLQVLTRTTTDSQTALAARTRAITSALSASSN